MLGRYDGLGGVMIHSDAPDLSALMIDATIDDAALDRLIDSIKAYLGAHGHMLLIHDPGRQIPSLSRTSVPQEYAELYAVHYQFEDLWLKAAKALPATHVFLGQEHVSDKAWTGTAMYQDFTRHIEHRHLLAMTDRAPGGCWIGFGFQRSTRAGPFDLTHKRWLTSLIPPLRSLFRVRSTMAGLRSIGQVGNAVLDLIPVPAMLVDPAARVVIANTACLQLTAAAAVMRLRGSQHESGLWVVSDAATQWLRQAISHVAHGTGQAVERAFRYDQDRGRPILISVMRVSGRLRDSVPQADLVLVLFFGPAERLVSLVDRLAMVFGLTAAEGRVVEALASGETLSHIAERTSVSIETVRTHLKHAFDKTGARRQAELVRLALRYAPP